MVEISHMTDTQPEVADEELTVTKTDVEFEDASCRNELMIVEEFKNGNIFGKIVPF